MTNHDAELLADINTELATGNWPDALEWAEDLDERADEVRSAIMDRFGITTCPHCEGQSDGDMYDCPCCDSMHLVDAEMLEAWSRSHLNPRNTGARHYYWEPEAA